MSTYYLVNDSTVIRATTKQAQTKLQHLLDINQSTIKSISPKDAKALIAQKREYWKIKDII